MINLKEILTDGLQKLINKIKEHGGKAMMVGGAVIELIRGTNKPKDIDIEIYKLTIDEIKDLVESLGFKITECGKLFGVLKTVIDGDDIDLSVPRRENKVGVGHKGFDVKCDPNMSVKEAAMRRDLTINSMAIDLIENKIVDPFNGLEDLKNGILRATNPKTFVEDPLRVLRIMQFLARGKGTTVTKDTIELCKSMINEFNELPKERVFEEFNKLLMKGTKPSLGLNFLRDCGWIVHFPELENLIGCMQHLEWHPEGDVWNHTCQVVDHGVTAKTWIPEEYRQGFMFGLLCHDMGKPETTKVGDDGIIRSHGHDTAGVKYAESFMNRLTNNKNLIEIVKKITKLHHRAGDFTRHESRVSAWKRLHNELRLDILAAVSCCDNCGRNRPLTQHAVYHTAMKYFKEFGEKKIEPILQGRHLIQIGMKPGPEFGKILKDAYELQIEHGINDPNELLKIMNLKESD